MKTFFSIIVILASILGVVLYVIPTYQSAQALQNEENELNSALTNARLLQEARDDLLLKFNAFTTQDINRLRTMLPDNIDNVKMIIELDALATQLGLSIQSIDVIESSSLSPEEEQARASLPYGVVDLSLQMEGPYERFVEVIEQIERSLRLIDVQDISFRSIDTSSDYTYNMTVRTYWLK